MSYSPRSRKQPSKMRASSNSLSSLFSSITRGSSSLKISDPALIRKSAALQRRISTDEASAQIVPHIRRNSPVGSPHTKASPSQLLDVFTFMEADSEEDGSFQDKEKNSVVSTSAFQRDSRQIAGRFNKTEPLAQSSSATEINLVEYHRQSTGFNSHHDIPITWSSPARNDASHQKDPTVSQASSKAPLKLKRAKSKSSSTWMTSSPSLEQFGNPDTFPESFYTMQPRDRPQIATSKEDVPHVHFSQNPSSCRQSEISSAKVVQATKTPKLTVRSGCISDVACENSSLPPIYRRFGNLSRRVLLQLQAEIASLESELLALDDAISAAERSTSNPRLLRQDVSIAQPAQLIWQRVGLSNIISAKLDVYHRALSSYGKVSRLPPASTKDVVAYKAFLEAQESVSSTDPNNGAFLHSLDDLTCITTYNSTGIIAKPTNWSGERPAAIAIGCGISMTIFVFQFLPGFFSRIALGSVILAAMIGSGLLPGFKESPLRVWHARCAAYAAAIFILALAAG